MVETRAEHRTVEAGSAFSYVMKVPPAAPGPFFDLRNLNRVLESQTDRLISLVGGRFLENIRRQAALNSISSPFFPITIAAFFIAAFSPTQLLPFFPIDSPSQPAINSRPHPNSRYASTPPASSLFSDSVDSRISSMLQQDINKSNDSDYQLKLALTDLLNCSDIKSDQELDAKAASCGANNKSYYLPYPSSLASLLSAMKNGAASVFWEANTGG
uniref:Uncharacterized protein n=1 Tax=Coccidioides posadasii RMSCC 3488 TaxID=454284 RepID=A0A0J6F664_COCPO|nr:hypothetical protein CPAG_02004 [Coccidioides posadasii RMSCC 3488]